MRSFLILALSIAFLFPFLSPIVRASGFSTTNLSVVASSFGFEGMNFSVSFGGVSPPDVQIAAGPNHLVETVNRDVMIYSKSGALLSHVTLNTFFNVGTDWTFDTRVVYDALSQRWFALTDDGTQSNVHIAVSNTNDPTGGLINWHFYVLGGIDIRCYDQPKMGYSTDKFVVAVDSWDLFSPPPPGSACSPAGQQAEQYWVLNKTDMVHASNSVSNVTMILPLFQYASLQPMQSLTPTNTIYMEGSGENKVRSNVTLVTLQGVPPGPVTNTTTTIVPTAPFSTLPTNGAPTPNGINVDLLDGTRTQSVVWYQGKLWSTFMVGCTPPADNSIRSCIQLLELNTTSTPVVIQNFDYATKGQYYFYPALSLEGSGNLDMIYGNSNSTSYPALAVTGQAWNNQQNTLAARLTVRQGNWTAVNRFGDYFDASPDPSNPAVVWTAGEYDYNAAGGTKLGWGTFISSVTLSEPNFSISANPSNLGQIFANGKKSSTLTITSVRGFSGTVSLSEYDNGGITASFTPATVSLSSGGSATSTLKLTFGNCGSIGPPPVTVDGQSGTIVQTTRITWGNIIC